MENHATNHQQKNEDLDAQYYLEHSSFQYGVATDFLKPIVFGNNESLLDVGCGDGKITAELAKQIPYGKVLGVDSSETMIQFAKKSFPKNPQLDFAVCRAEDIHYPNSFDKVISVNALHWVRDLKTALTQIVESLKQAGSLYILTYPKESPYYLFLEEVIQSETWRQYSPSAYPTMMTSEEYIHALTDLGMKMINYHVQEATAMYDDKDTLIDYVKGWLVCFASLPHEIQPAFLNDAADRALKDYGKDGQIHLPYKMLTIEARKS